MKAILAAAALALATTAAQAQVASQSFYFHQGSGVAVPGGTTDHFLDQTAPAGTTLVVEPLVVASQTSAAYPRFVGTALPSATLLGPIVKATLHLQANQQISPQCVRIDVAVLRVAADGATATIGTAQLSTSIPQGAANGTGFVAIPVDLDLTGDRLLAAGESVALDLTIDNLCNSNRTVRLVHDAAAAPTRVEFLGLELGAAQCLETIDKALEKYLKSRSTYLSKCHDAVNTGKLAVPDCATDAPTQAKVAKAAAKFVSGIHTKCAAGLVIDDAPSGLGVAACPGIGGQCQFAFGDLDDGVRGNGNDYVDCMLCMADVASDGILAVDYASTTPPVMETFLGLCQATIGKTGIKYADKALKLLQTCRKGQNAGKVSGPCPDMKTATKITKEIARIGTRVAAKCTDAQVVDAAPAGLGLSACAGPPVSCQAPIAAAADQSDCMACTHGQYVACLFPATVGKTAPGCN